MPDMDNRYQGRKSIPVKFDLTTSREGDGLGKGRRRCREIQKKNLGRASLVRLNDVEHSRLKEESVDYEISMARILVHSFINRERPTRESLRQREELIFLLRRLQENLRALPRQVSAFDEHHAHTLDTLISEVHTALNKVGAAFSPKRF
jgi:hypothetical protein